MHKKMREIEELKAKGVSNRGAAEKTGYARNTVNKIVKQINEAGLTYDEVRNLSDQMLSKHFNDPVSSRRNQDFFLLNFELLTKELAKPGVTMQLLWEEYMTECRMQKKKGYQLTQFKKHFNDHLNVHQFKDILKRKAGESIEVDWAGQRPHWSDPDTVATDQLTDISLPSYGRLPDLLKSCPQLVRICPPIVDIRSQPAAKHIRIIINFRSGSSKYFFQFCRILCENASCPVCSSGRSALYSFSFPRGSSIFR